MPSVTPSQAMKMPPVSFRFSLACPQPGRRNERQKAPTGLIGRITALSRGSGPTSGSVGATAVESWAWSRRGAAPAARRKNASIRARGRDTSRLAPASEWASA